ncbi:hypothetical protein SEA_PHINKY_67 [Microbacterium phage Phinky]|nr:hypothetical protein SEA_PHINKY_67 [Microbacterium phage Phinky]
MALHNTKVTESEIDDALNDANDSIDEGTSRWPGMTYEQGVAAALNWIHNDDVSPFEEN